MLTHETSSEKTKTRNIYEESHPTIVITKPAARTAS